ncbi:MAG TPA: NirA family protein [Fibrobacteria bacterium]|nr:NirA family protein [Fibrobacteria bacterium]
MGAPGTPFTIEQKEYLEGFLRAFSGQPAAPARPAAAVSSAAPDAAQAPPGKQAQLAWLASGKRLSKEEKIKFDADPLDAWPRIAELSAQDKLPEGEDLYRFKTHGLWNVSPAQESMMCRLRFPGGVLRAHQAQAVADAAEAYGGGYVDLTTRANLQIREIPGRHMASLLTDLHEAGIVPRGSGADNIRNVTGNPTCGIDAREFYDVLPLCRQLHHHILHDRSLYGLPRKFNVAFDGGNSISSLEDTNDIGLKAVRVDAGRNVEPGVYFRVALGGITGHGDLARDTGLVLKPEECIPVIAAMIRVYVLNGDRGNRKRARLKYVLDAWGFAKFLDETQKLLPFALRRLPETECRFAPPIDKAGHLGVHPQRQAGLCYVGVDVPVGRLTVAQLRGLADLSRKFGSGTLRLTVWQNLLVSDISEARLGEALSALGSLGLTHEPDPIQAGLVACTGAEGCKFGMAATKSTALAISAHLRGLPSRLGLDAPVNIHLTGCAHSCAQHFIGDIGLIAASVDTEAYKGPGFHFFIGGGYGNEGRMAAPARRSVPVPEVPAEIERILSLYLEKRLAGETFSEFAEKRSGEELQKLFAAPGSRAAEETLSADAGNPLTVAETQS